MEVSGQLHVPAALLPAKQTPVHIVGPRVYLDITEKRRIFTLTGNRNPTLRSSIPQLGRNTE
jgi:hypothetical protein